MQKPKLICAFLEVFERLIVFRSTKDLLHLTFGGSQWCYEATHIFRKEQLYISAGPCFITATAQWECASDHCQANLTFVAHKSQVSLKPQLSLETCSGTLPPTKWGRQRIVLLNQNKVNKNPSLKTQCNKPQGFSNLCSSQLCVTLLEDSLVKANECLPTHSHLHN